MSSMHPRELTRGQRDAANLYVAYSVKLRRYVEVIGPASYEFWLLLEWDTAVTSFCERPDVETLQDRSNAEGATKHLQPDFWIRKKNQTPYFVRLAARDALTLTDDGRWKPLMAGSPEASPMDGLDLRWVTDTYLQDNAIGIRNRKRLIHYVTEYAARPHDDLYELIYRYIAHGRPRTWSEVEDAFHEQTSHAVRAVVAKLLYDGRLHASLDSQAVSPMLLLEDGR